MQPNPSSMNPYADIRRVNMRVTFELIDQHSAEEAVPSTNGQAFVSNLPQLVDRNEVIYGQFATLEQNFWRLDGSLGILPSNYSGRQFGWFSSGISRDDKTFSVNPTLTFSFSEDISSIGFTLVFDSTHNQWPTRYHVATYDANDAVITEADITNDSVQSIVYLLSPNYRKVVFTFSKTSEPHRRVRVCEVLFGIIQHFDKSNISNASLTYGADVKSASLPSRVLSFTFDNSDQKYNLINPQGIYAYLQEGQPIDAEVSINGSAWVNMGRYYFASSEAVDEALTATITASDKLLWLDSSTCRIGMSGTWTMSSAVAAVLADAQADDIEVSIPSSLSSVTVGKQIPSDASHREALRLLAQAACCACWIDRDGVLVFKKLELGTACDSMTKDNMKSMNGISVSERINTVELTVQDPYVQGSTATVYTATDCAQDESVHSVSITNPCAYSGQTVVDWLLACYQRRLKYKLQSRGNPLLEISDTVSVQSAYGDIGQCAITGIDLIYDGGLSATISGQGGIWQ